MVSLTRAVARLLDHLPRRRFARLSAPVAVFVLALGALLVPAVALALPQYPDYATALSACQHDAANGGYYAGLPANSPTKCVNGTSPDTASPSVSDNAVLLYWCDPRSNPSCSPNMVHNAYTYSGSPPPPSNPCTSIPTTSMFMDGKILDGTTFSENEQDSNGNWVPCSMTFSPTGRPIWNPYSGVWQTYGTAAPTGNPASTSMGDAAGIGNWIGPGGGSMDPQPTNDPANGTNAPPKVCDGGSCYDPSTDQYCSVSGGVQSCVSGSTASSGGGCTDTPSGGAICGGSPLPPLPNVPTIDPATGISSTDTFLTANPVTGGTVTTTINNYPAPGQTTSSGQTTTDSGPLGGGTTQSAQGSSSSPAHASSAGGNGTLSGGTSCDTPPVCTGDSVLCGIARTDWSATCQVHKDLSGDGTGATAMASALSANPPSNAWVSTSTSGNATADNANAGIYDSSGFGYGTQCPMQDLTVPLGDNSFVVPFSKGCVIGPWIAGVIKAFALFSALLITMGKRS